MNHTLKALIYFALTVGLAAQAQAQTVTYQFTGSVHPDRGSDNIPGIGSTIAGSVTLDLGAAPDGVFDFSGLGQYGLWYDGNFAIDGLTDTGVVAGTSLGGSTEFQNWDLPLFPYQQNGIAASYYADGIHSSYIEIQSYSETNSGDSVPSVPNPWNPKAEQTVYIYVYDYDFITSPKFGFFQLDTFTVDVDTDGDGILDSVDACPNSDLRPTVVIDGRDSGVKNYLQKNGCTISDLIVKCAANATNHGKFVSCVAALTNQLKKDGIITGKEKDAIQSCAAKSKIGK